MKRKRHKRRLLPQKRFVLLAAAAGRWLECLTSSLTMSFVRNKTHRQDKAMGDSGSDRSVDLAERLVWTHKASETLERSRVD